MAFFVFDINKLGRFKSVILLYFHSAESFTTCKR